MHTNALYNGEYLHCGLLTKGMLEDGGMLIQESLELIDFYFKNIFKKMEFQSAIIVSDGDLASVETSHILCEMLRCIHSSRCMVLKGDFWNKSNLEIVLADMTEKTIFEDDLWIFVGSPQYLSHVAWSLLGTTEYCPQAPFGEDINPAALWAATLFGNNLKWLRPVYGL